MIYADSVSLVRNAQCHTLVTRAGHLEIELLGEHDQLVCPGCSHPTRAVLVQEFDAFHVCGNTACRHYVPRSEVAALLCGIENMPVTRHGA